MGRRQGKRTEAPTETLRGITGSLSGFCSYYSREPTINEMLLTHIDEGKSL